MKTFLFFIIYITGLLSNTVNASFNPGQDTSVNTILKGKIPGLHDDDQISLTISDFYIGVTHTTTTLISAVKNECFSFDLSSYERPVYINFQLPANVKCVNKSLFSRVTFLVIPNDNILLTVENNDFLFKGANANAYAIQYKMSKINDIERQKDAHIDFADIPKIKDIFNIADSTQTIVLKYLDNNKEKLDRTLYNTIKYNCVLQTAIEKYFLLNFRKIKIMDIGMASVPKVNIDSIYSEGIYFPNLIPQFLDVKFKYDSCTYLKKTFELGKFYSYIKQTFQGEIKDYLLTYQLVKNLKSDSLSKYTLLAFQDVQDDKLKGKLKEITTGMLEGQPIVNFSFSDTSGNLHRLSNYEGKVILMDFWFTGCVGCKEITPFLDKVARKLKDDNVVFLSISIDKDGNLWKKSVKDGTYSFSNSIKLFTSNQGDKHPAIRGLKVIGYPTLIILDKDRKLVRAPIDPRIDDGKDLIRLIREKMN